MSESSGYRKKMARNIAIENGITVNTAHKIIEDTLKMIVEIVAQEGRVELRNFGVFESVQKAPRKGRNPKTGSVVYVPKTYKIKFKPGKQMLGKVIEESNKKELDVEK